MKEYTMNALQPEASDSDEFPGFEEARTLMWCYEDRARTHARLNQTDLIADESVVAVHVENTSRADRVFLSAFDREGRLLRGDTLYVDDANERLDVTAEFDHDYTGMPVAEGSELKEAIARENGWVVDMHALREYNPGDDRGNTQRAVLVAHLGDMMASGQARGFLLGKDDVAEGPGHADELGDAADTDAA
ncbi:hypothetical protein ACFRAU_07285 [Arthrobacter sp. NPDC056691]|uniref:hypothetical protein n=1 Tax=Arthrobacter sp. NPDC056691 TaxID=3345913 RepID=UPI00366BBA61